MIESIACRAVERAEPVLVVKEPRGIGFWPEGTRDSGRFSNAMIRIESFGLPAPGAGRKTWPKRSPTAAAPIAWRLSAWASKIARAGGLQAAYGGRVISVSDRAISPAACFPARVAGGGDSGDRVVGCSLPALSRLTADVSAPVDRVEAYKPLEIDGPGCYTLFQW